MHAAAVGARIVANIAKGQSIEEAVQQSLSASMTSLKQRFDSPVASAVEIAQSQPRQTTKLAQLAPDTRAVAALAGGVYVALSFPERDQIRDALLFATSSGIGNHVAAIAGALLGAAHGADALPVDWLSDWSWRGSRTSWLVTSSLSSSTSRPAPSTPRVTIRTGGIAIRAGERPVRIVVARLPQRAIEVARSCRRGWSSHAR